MSDRRRLIIQRSGKDTVELFMDGESGTWRLFVNHESIDLSLVGLRQLQNALGDALGDIEKYPERYNAELLAKDWEAAE